MRRYSKNGWEKRKSDREGYSEFFEKHVGEIKKLRAICIECGCRLIGDVSEVAHILEKSFFKSVATDDENVIYLCSWKSENNCHGKFDGSVDQLHSMKIFEKIKPTVEKLLNEKVTEKYNYKKTDRWQI